jgi:hypothetical protein
MSVLLTIFAALYKVHHDLTDARFFNMLRISGM